MDSFHLSGVFFQPFEQNSLKARHGLVASHFLRHLQDRVTHVAGFRACTYPVPQPGLMNAHREDRGPRVGQQAEGLAFHTEPEPVAHRLCIQRSARAVPDPCPPG